MSNLGYLPLLQDMKKRVSKNEMSLKSIEALKSLIYKLYPDTTTVPERYFDISYTFDELGTTFDIIDSVQLNYSSRIAFVARKGKNDYDIFINSQADVNDIKYLMLHEKGHVYFSHLIYNEAQEQQIYNSLKASWKMFAQYFTQNVLDKGKDVVIEYLVTKFSNIAQDMEINSKLFKNDYEQLRLIGQKMSYLTMINSHEIGRANRILYVIDKLIKACSGDFSDAALCHPSNYPGLPLGLDWMFYMSYLVNHANIVIQQIASNAIGDHKLKDIDDISLPQIGENDVCSNVADQQAKKQYNTYKPEKESEDHKTVPNVIRGTGTGLFSNQLIDINTPKINAITKAIVKNVFKKQNTRLESNSMYYINKGRRTAADVITPRRQYNPKPTFRRVTFIIDVSSSINISVAKSVIKTVKSDATIDKNNSHVILWDTALVRDYRLCENIMYSGGGNTAIDEGIRYAKKYLTRPTDLLFIVSDFEDDLNLWMKESDSIKQDIVSVFIDSFKMPLKKFLECETMKTYKVDYKKLQDRFHIIDVTETVPNR